MRVLGIIPARAGSKRIPDKNFRDLAGRPLVDYVMNAAQGASSITKLVVSSDSPQVLKIAEKYPAILRIHRPQELATDVSPAIDYVRHALEYLRKSGESPYDVIVILQPSSPLTTPQDIDATVNLLAEETADSAVSVKEVPHDLNPLKFKTIEAGRLLPYFEEEKGRMSAHELPLTYVRNGSVYATRASTIERGEIIGADCRAHIMPAERSVDINDEMDFLLAEILVQQSFSKKNSAASVVRKKIV